MIFESGINAFILSPMATLTDHQRKGVGQKLINSGLKTLKEDGAELAITYGDFNFYSKVGFAVIPKNLIHLRLNYHTSKDGWLNP